MGSLSLSPSWEVPQKWADFATASNHLIFQTHQVQPVLTMSGHGGLLSQSQNNQTSGGSISPSFFLLILSLSKVFILPLL